ncbi:MAG: NYN domain-containing protein [Patescibacteria group bacterium]
MIQHKDQRVGVFVDVQNLYYSARFLYGKHVNFGKVLDESVSGRRLIRAIAYVIKTQTGEESPFFEALGKQGFEVKMKELQIFSGGQKKGDWDVGLAIDAIRMSSKLDVVVIVSGDGDYLPLVEYLQNHGVLVEVVAFGGSCSNKLREANDRFIDLSQDDHKFLINYKNREGAQWMDQNFNEAQNRNESNNKEKHNMSNKSQQKKRRIVIPFLNDRGKKS